MVRLSRIRMKVNELMAKSQRKRTTNPVEIRANPAGISCSNLFLVGRGNAGSERKTRPRAMEPIIFSKCKEKVGIMKRKGMGGLTQLNMNGKMRKWISVISAKNMSKLARVERERRRTAGWQTNRQCHSEMIKVGGKGEWMRRQQRTE